MCLFEYIIKRVPSNVEYLSIFSDKCAGQNRNVQLSVILLRQVQKTNLKVIEQKFLESDHSYMEVDAMHSAIEFQQQKTGVFTIQVDEYF